MHSLDVCWQREMTMLSRYAEKLPSEAKKRYQNKLLLIGGVDLFCISQSNHESSLPAVDASDLVSYLVLQTSYITAKHFNARKSFGSI